MSSGSHVSKGAGSGLAVAWPCRTIHHRHGQSTDGDCVQALRRVSEALGRRVRLAERCRIVRAVVGESARPVPTRPVHSSHVAIKPAVVVETYALRGPSVAGATSTNATLTRRNALADAQRFVHLHDIVRTFCGPPPALPHPGAALLRSRLHILCLGSVLGLALTVVAGVVTAIDRVETLAARCRRTQTQAVAGYDLTFSPVKSVSAV
jgi:hypothetical protein